MFYIVQLLLCMVVLFLRVLYTWFYFVLLCSGIGCFWSVGSVYCNSSLLHRVLPLLCGIPLLFCRLYVPSVILQCSSTAVQGSVLDALVLILNMFFYR